MPSLERAGSEGKNEVADISPIPPRVAAPDFPPQ